MEKYVVIAWESTTGGFGHGQSFLPEESAMELVKDLNKKHQGEIHHFLLDTVNELSDWLMSKGVSRSDAKRRTWYIS